MVLPSIFATNPPSNWANQPLFNTVDSRLVIPTEQDQEIKDVSFQEDKTYLKKYKEHQAEEIDPEFEEVFLFHNKGKAHVSSCGAIAWQVWEKIKT